MTRLLADTWLLLDLRRQMAWNAYRSRSLVRKILPLVVGALVAFGAGSASAGIGFGAGQLLRRYPQLQLDALLPGLILTVAALMLLVVSFGIALGSLFLASDLELLMSAPVDRRSVFVSKLLDGLSWYYAILAITALPALVTYGLGQRYAPPYYLLAALTLLCVPLLPAGLGALLVLLVARFAPARRVREVLGLAAALTGASCSVAGQTARTWTRQLGSVAAGGDPRALVAPLRQLAELPIPSFVAGKGLTAAGAGQWLAALADLAGFLLLTVGLFAGCVVLADRLYTTGWVRMQSSGSARRSRERVRREAAHSGWLGRAPAALALALKDWRVIPRDLRNFAQLLTPLLVLPAVYVNLLSGSGRRGFNPLAAANRLSGGVIDARGALLAAGLLVITVLVFSRLALTSISREGRSWWVLKAAPLTADEVLRGKLLAVALPFAVLSTVLMAAAALWSGLSLLGSLYGWYGLEVLGLSMLALDVALSVPWANLEWDDPRRMGSGWASLASFFGCGLLAIAGGALLCLPLLASALWPAMEPASWLVGALAALLLTWGPAFLALRLAATRLYRVGEA